MQRSIIDKEYLKYIYLLLLIVYDSIATMHNMFPPLLGIISIYFYKSIKEKSIYFTYAIILFLIIFEANREFIFFSISTYLLISYFYIIPHFKNITVCKKCLESIYIVIAYIGYSIFSIILSYILNSEYISIDIFMIVYYVLIEIFIVLVFI
jgi:hypothetical protein